MQTKIRPMKKMINAEHQEKHNQLGEQAVTTTNKHPKWPSSKQKEGRRRRITYLEGEEEGRSNNRKKKEENEEEQ